MTEQTMTRWEAMGRLWAAKVALDSFDLLGVISAADLPLTLACEMELNDILDACSVRLTDIARVAGLRK